MFIGCTALQLQASRQDIFVFLNYMNLLTMLLGMCCLTTEEVLEMKTWTQELHRTDLYSAQGRTSLTHLPSARTIITNNIINQHLLLQDSFYSPRHHTTACLFTPLPVK